MIRRLSKRVGTFLDGTGVRWTIGVALPIVLIAVDPAVFHSRVFGVGLPILGVLKPFCYTATGLALVFFVVWLIRTQPSAFTSGAFAGATLFAVLLGTAILPFSLLGIFFLGLGLLGLSPFLMAAVYWRAARAASWTWRTSAKGYGSHQRPPCDRRCVRQCRPEWRPHRESFTTRL